MKNKTQLSAFSFKFSGYGHYLVTYTSPKTGKTWSKMITDMTIIDDTRNADDPKQKDIDRLKKIVKN